MFKRGLVMAIICIAGVPAIVYWVGGLLAGPYKGENGLPGLMGAIYGDALSGEFSALLLLLSPALLVAIWLAVGRLRRFT